jgi:hypothetical protein
MPLTMGRAVFVQTARRINWRTRGSLLATAAWMAIGMPAHAQNPPPSVLPEIRVIEPPPPPKRSAHERCVDVTIGDDRSFGCLNEKLKKKVDQVNPLQNIPPVDARSSDLKVGTVNMPGVQQQYGQNFGRSVIPYRPAPPVFAPPLGHR